MKRCGQFSEILYILVVIVSKARKLLDFLYTCWCGSGSNFSNLVQVNTNTTVFHNVTKILYTALSRLIFSSLGVKLFAM